MILRKKCLSLFLSLSLVLPNLAPIYSYAEEATSINREEQKIKSENSQKEKVSKQLDEKFDLNDVSGDYAAEQINKYKLQDNFEYAVKEVLNYYYDEDKKDSCKNKEYGLSELFSDYNKLLKQIDKINKKVENTSIYHKKIAESDDRDITVEDSLINIHNVIGKFSRCIQISIEIDEQNNYENVLDGQMSIDEIWV